MSIKKLPLPRTLDEARAQLKALRAHTGKSAEEQNVETIYHTYLRTALPPAERLLFLQLRLRQVIDTDEGRLRIEEEALFQALKERALGVQAGDAWQESPYETVSSLGQAPNIVCHAAGSTGLPTQIPTCLPVISRRPLIVDQPCPT